MVKSQKIRQYYGIFLAVMTVLVGVTFIVAVSQVYYGGLEENPDYPFSIERIREHILLPFVFLLCWIAAIIVGIVLSIVFPVAEQRATYKNNGKILERMKNRIPTAGSEEYTTANNALKKYEKIRMCVWGVAMAMFLAAAVTIFVYVFNITHYHADALKSDILNLVKNVLSWTLAGLVVGIVAVIVDEILLKRAINATKTAIVAGDKDALPQPKQTTRKAVITATVSVSVIVGVALVAYALAPVIIKSAFNWFQTVIYVVVFAVAALIVAGFAVYHTVKPNIPHKVNKILLLTTRIVVGVIAVTFVLVGIFNGGANDVLIKAINICTECIGLG